MSTEITTGKASALSEYLASVDLPVMTTGRLIFGLDATMSRQETWDTAARIQADMFKEVGGLSVKLIYFRGEHECKASSWVSSPQRLGDIMRTIICRTGETQIGKVLAHARRENCPLVFVGDKVEEDADELCAKVRLLRAPAFMFQEGEDEKAERVFRQIADITKGAFAKFEPGAAAKLAELLRAVAAYAVGGIEALDAEQVRLIGRNRDGL